jgi:hypothetical protein
VTVRAIFEATRHVLPLPAFAVLATRGARPAPAGGAAPRDGLPLDRLLAAAWSRHPGECRPRGLHGIRAAVAMVTGRGGSPAAWTAACPAADPGCWLRQAAPGQASRGRPGTRAG